MLRVVTYLKNLDQLREKSNTDIDSILANIDIEKLLKNPRGVLRAAMIKHIYNSQDSFKIARDEGRKLAKSL